MTGHAELLPFDEAFRAVTAARGWQTALVFKSLGRWQSLSWSAVAEHVTRAAAGLAHLGVTRGGLVAIDGEVTPRLLIVAAAARTLGANIVAVPLRAGRSTLDALILDPRVQFVAGHGRETVAEWQQFSAGHRAVPILFDHVTPESKSPGEGVLTYQQLISLVPVPAEKVADTQKHDITKPRIIWFAETTDWAGGLDAALDVWLRQPVALALPESQRAASRDLIELQPDGWLASGATLASFQNAIDSRLPPPGHLLRRLIDAALAGGGAPWHALLRLALRRQSGLARAKSIHLASGETLAQDVQLFLERIGVTVSTAASAPSQTPHDRGEDPLVFALAAQ